MKIRPYTIKLQTKSKYQFIDITEMIKKAIKNSKVKNGIINIVSKHATTAILLNENELLLWEDFSEHIKDLFYDYLAGYYQHDDLKLRRKFCSNMPRDECQNAGAHCRSIFLTNSQTLNIKDGELDLGPWQQIIFVELDRQKEREISIMILGK
jgi:secondary thiamine-phosphate synthase enzyme